MGSPDAVTKEALNMQDSAEDQSFQLQQTIKTGKEERKEKACLGCNLLVQEKESHIKLALLPPPFYPLFSGFIQNPSLVSCMGPFIEIF